MANNLKSRYEKLTQERRPYLERARLAAKLTLPSLIPDEGHTKETNFETPWQSVGSRGVNNLASKMLLSLMPPNSPFFRMKVDEAELAEMDGPTRGDLETGLTAYERVVTDDIEDAKARASMFQGFKHLVVAGNGLLKNTDDGSVRLYPLSRYVVKRDAEGTVYEIIATDHTVFGALPKEVRDAVLLAGAGDGKSADDDVTIYTGILRGDNEWQVWQEVMDVVLPNSVGSYPLDASPWIPLRMVAVDGESYGRSFIEEIYGDLNTVDALTQAITEASAAAAIVKFLVDPNGTTDIDDVTDAPNGGFATGREQDISTLQVNKNADLQVAKAHLAEVTARLQYAFLLSAAVQRDAERVTAEEIRFMAQELEDALGGIYSVLAEELQLPMVKYRMKKLAREKKLPTLPKSIKPNIITGLEALGRNQEHQRLRVFVGDVTTAFGPEVSSEYMKVDEYIKRSGAAMNVETNGLVRSDEEVQQRRQQRAEAEAQAAAAAQQQPQE